MLRDVVAIKYAGEFKLELSFDDGAAGIVDITKVISFTGVFSDLSNPDYFKRAAVNTELGTVTWPNGADLDSDVLYYLATGKPILGSSGKVLAE